MIIVGIGDLVSLCTGIQQDSEAMQGIHCMCLICRNTQSANIHKHVPRLGSETNGRAGKRMVGDEQRQPADELADMKDLARMQPICFLFEGHGRKPCPVQDLATIHPCPGRGSQVSSRLMPVPEPQHALPGFASKACQTCVLHLSILKCSCRS